MKKLGLFALAILLAAPAIAGTVNTFDLKGVVSSVGGDYDANGQWVATNVLLYGSYGGVTWHNRVWCSGGCAEVVVGQCATTSGTIDQGVLTAETFTVSARADCF